MAESAKAKQERLAAEAAAKGAQGADAVTVTKPGEQAQPGTNGTEMTIEQANKNAADKAGGNTDVATQQPEEVNPQAAQYKSMLEALEAKADSVLMDADAEYLKPELGRSYNVLFTGDTQRIPDKINKENADGVICVCGFMIGEGGALKPFINADVMVVNKVAEWSGKGMCSRESPLAVRMKVDAALAGETGKQFKKISFLVD